MREDNGHIYTVAPDAKGLPIGYIKSSMNESPATSVKKAAPPKPTNPMNIPATDPYWHDVKATGGFRSGLSWKVYLERDGVKWGKLQVNPPGGPYKFDELVSGSLEIEQGNGSSYRVHHFDVKLTDPNHPLVKTLMAWVEQEEKKPKPPVDHSAASSWNR